MTTALRVVEDDDLHFDVSSYHALRALAEMYSDIQKTRIGIGNRLGRGEGFGGMFRDHVDGLEAMEHQWQLDLVRQFRKTVPAGVRSWQKTERGIGEPLLARLLGHLGHPRIALPQHWEGTGSNRKLVEDEAYVRTRAQLRAYCGHGDPNRKKFSGMSAEDAFRLGNPRCKMLVHLLAEACAKQPGTPVSVLLDPDQSTSDSHGLRVGVEGLPATNDQGKRDEPQRRSVVDGTPLLDPDQGRLASQHLYVGVEDPSATNGQLLTELQGRGVVGGKSKAAKRRLSPVNDDHHGADSQASRVAVDGSSLTSSDHTNYESQGGRVAAGETPRYRLVYEQRRLATVGRVHDGPCVRCGPSGHPAGDGSPWSAQHQQADALRIVGKAILNDLWDAAEV